MLQTSKYEMYNRVKSAVLWPAGFILKKEITMRHFIFTNKLLRRGETLLVLLFAFFLLSCNAHAPRVLSDRYKTIHISVFKNRTQEFALEERLTSDMIKVFERDGRLKAETKNQADLLMEVRITKIVFLPIAFTNIDRAIGYNMTVYVEVDVKNNTAAGEYIMQKKPFSATGSYLLNNNPASTDTQSVSSALAEQVISYLIEGW